MGELCWSTIARVCCSCLFIGVADFMNLLGEEGSTMRSAINEPSSPSSLTNQQGLTGSDGLRAEAEIKDMRLREESGELKTVEWSDALEQEIRMVLRLMQDVKD